MPYVCLDEQDNFYVWYTHKPILNQKTIFEIRKMSKTGSLIYKKTYPSQYANVQYSLRYISSIGGIYINGDTIAFLLQDNSSGGISYGEAVRFIKLNGQGGEIKNQPLPTSLMPSSSSDSRSLNIIYSGVDKYAVLYHRKTGTNITTTGHYLTSLEYLDENMNIVKTIILPMNNKKRVPNFLIGNLLNPILDNNFYESFNVEVNGVKDAGFAFNKINLDSPLMRLYLPSREDVVLPTDASVGSNIINFRAKYRNYRGLAPLAPFPRVNIYENGAPIANNPFIMTAVENSTDYAKGIEYQTNNIELFVRENAIYTYTLEAADGIGSFISDFYTLYNPAPTQPIAISQNANGQSVKTAGLKLEWYSEGKVTPYLNYTVSIAGPYDTSTTNYDWQVVYAGTSRTYFPPLLENGKYYYWKVEATSQEGATSESHIFSFNTVSVEGNKSFNYPNPFNPNRVSTKIVFQTPKNEIVRIKIYTLNGKIVFKDTYNALAGTNEYEYKGKDGNGKTLYNGVYVCVIEKSGGNAKCKIAIVK